MAAPIAREVSEIRSILRSALVASDPEQAVSRCVTRMGDDLQIEGRTYALKKFRRILVLAAGKSALSMARAMLKILEGLSPIGFVVVPHGAGEPIDPLSLVTASHPLPDRKGLLAAETFLSWAKGAERDDLVILLFSGGASSLLPAPVGGVRLSEKRNITNLLLKSGARIDEVNRVRKHLSRIKGGWLISQVYPATFFALLQSDVLTEDLSVIGSGLTSPDPSTFEESIAVLTRYGIWRSAPKSIKNYLRKGVNGKVPETPKEGNRIFDQGISVIISSNKVSLEAAYRQAEILGYNSLILSTTLQGEAREVGRVYGAIAWEIHRFGRPLPRPACILSGGEPTVTVRGQGRGGRAQEFALSAAIEISGIPRTIIVGFGTDGRDGPTPAAGAMADGETVDRARKVGIDPEKYLRKNNSYPLFRSLGDLIITGPTGSNVNDIYVLLMP